VKRNTFSKALKHLKSTELDEKIKRLNEAPTNSMSGVYALNDPGFRLNDPDPERIFYADVDGNWPAGIPGTPGELSYTRPKGFWNSGPGTVPAVQTTTTRDYTTLSGAGGLNTDNLIRSSDGFVLADLPPNSRNFILGPLVDGYVLNHGYDDFTNIGYIQKDTRQFVLLASIPGHWSSNLKPVSGSTPRQWNGSSITIYNANFTLAMATWFSEQILSGEFTAAVPYKYSGGVPQTPFPDPNNPGFVSGNLGSRGRRGGAGDSDGNPQNSPQKGNQNDAGFPWELFGKIKDFLGKIAQGPESFFPKGTLVGDAIQNAMSGGVNHAVEYNALLPVYLGLSILTGQKLEIPVSPSATKNMVGKIDANQLSNVLRINTPTPTTAQETIRPSSGKTTSVMKDSMGWGAQGGLTYNYNTNSSQLEITSNKTLRTTSGGETVKTATQFGGLASPGKITSFTDIPAPSIPQVQDAATKLISAVSTKLGGPGLDPNLPLNIQLSGMRDKYNSNDISRVAVEMGLTLTKTMTQGAASNIVALRKVLVDNNIVPKSDVEKIGGAYGQVSNVYKVDYNDLPSNVKSVIDKKVGVKESKEVFSESHQRILREIKQPVKVEDPQPQKLKNYRPNFAGRYTAQNTPDVTASPESDAIVKAKNAAGQTWRTKDKHWSTYESTERMNIVYDNVGHGSQYWDMIVNENQMKKVMRDREVQEQLNIIAHEKAMLREDPLYQSPFKKPIQEQETLQADSDPLFKKVKNKLKPVIDYPDKPSKLGYPDEPPPEMVNGMHPQYGERGNYYNALDPHSANAMPSTGNPEIDAKVRRAKTLKKVLGKKA